MRAKSVNKRTGVRLTAGALAMAGGAALFVAAPAASGQPAAKVVGPKISVTQSPLAAMSTCMPASQALSYTAFSDASTFRLQVRASAPLCDPVSATAAIYAMPADGSVWPQTLSETKAFTISGASLTEITFVKDCTPAQFDVVTGGTPQVISPLGEKHGPLLIPDTGTAYQDPGAVCEPVATTVPASTTTSPNATTTSVAGTVVGNTTTTAVVVAGISTTPTTAPPRVLDTSTDRSSGSSSPSELAVTGSSSSSMAYGGVGLFVAGVLMVVASRRRLTPAVRMITSSASVSPNSPFGLD